MTRISEQKTNSMVNVAIAGGTGAVGKTLIEVMASQTKHQAVVLTRKVLTPARIFSKTPRY